MRFKFTREFYVPKKAVKVADKKSDAVAYLTETAGKLYGAVFFGKQAKPIANYRFRSAAEREKTIGDLFKSRQATLAAKKERIAVKKAWVCPFKAGDIFKTSWGYDQTNVEYFELIEMKGKMGILREIAQERVETGRDYGTCTPMTGNYIGKPLKKLAQQGGFRISECQWASYVEPKIIGGVPVLPVGRWSAYA